MPVYEYECKACGRDFEYQQRMSDPDKTTCEACGGALDRLISRTAFALKGSGWYKDLYASPKPEAAQKSDGADGKPGSEAKTDGKGDKPAAKPDAKKDAKTDAPAASDKPAAKSTGSGNGSGPGSGGSGGSSGSTSGGSSGSGAKASERMAAIRIDGKAVAAPVRAAGTQAAAALRARGGGPTPPGGLVGRGPWS